MSGVTPFLIALVLLAANAFFVGAEFAVLAARRSQVEPLAEQGRRSARASLWAMERVPLILAGAQLGITLCSLGLGAIAEPAVAHLLDGPFEAAGLPRGLVHPVSLGVALGIVIYAHVVIGEMVPKNLALATPERAVLVLAPPMAAFARLLHPVIRVLNSATGVLLRAMRIEPRGEITSAFTAAEVYSIVTESRREGVLVDEPGLLTAALEFSERVAGEVMVPLADLVTVPTGTTPEQVERLIAKTGFSRFPVTAAPEPGTQAGPQTVGYLHLKDLLRMEGPEYTEPISLSRIRTLETVPCSAEVEEALAAMQRSGTHLLRVAEDGVTVGVVFLEDILEELVGEVRDATQRLNGR